MELGASSRPGPGSSITPHQGPRMLRHTWTTHRRHVGVAPRLRIVASVEPKTVASTVGTSEVSYSNGNGSGGGSEPISGLEAPSVGLLGALGLLVKTSLLTPFVKTYAQKLGPCTPASPADLPAILLEAFNKHGYVFKFDLPQNRLLYCFAGAGALQEFYNLGNVRRFPASSQKLMDNAWLWKGGYAIPPLDGEAHLQRKRHLIASITSRESAEKYLAALDSHFVKAFSEAGRDGKPFSWQYLVAKTYMVTASKVILGYGIEEYGNVDEVVQQAQDAFDVFNQQLSAKDKNTKGYKAMCTYFEAVLEKYREDPSKFVDTGFGRYMADAGQFIDGEIVLDMHQVFVNGTLGILMGAVQMAYLLARMPEVLAKLKKELKDVKEVSFESLRNLPYTFAFVKEMMRFYPQVVVLKGVSVREFQAGKFKIPSGVPILALLHATGWDPAVHPNPEKFDPERWLPPRSEGEDRPEHHGYLVAMGWGDSLTGHACGGKNVGVTFLLDVCVRMVQAWDFQMADPNEKLLVPGFGCLAMNGLILKRSGKS